MILGRGGGLQYLWQGGSMVMTLVFEIINSIGPMLCLNKISLTFLLLQTQSVCLYLHNYIVPEIIQIKHLSFLAFHKLLSRKVRNISNAVYHLLRLSFMSVDIIGPKVDIIFHPNLLFNHFEIICLPFFSMILDLVAPFVYYFQIFLTPQFCKTLDLIRSIFHCVLPNIW